MHAPAPTHGIRPSLADLAVPMDQLRPHADNPNDGDADRIATSLQQYGQYRPVVAWRQPDGTGVVLAGNTTYAAAAQLGWSHLAATWVDADTEAEAVGIMLADNRLARLARMNGAQELELLQRLADADHAELVAAAGYTWDEVDDLAAQAELAAALPLRPDAPEPRHAEDDAELAERAASRLGGTRVGAGLREALMVLPEADYAELMTLYDAVRAHTGDRPQGQLALVTARLAAAVLGRTLGHELGHTCDACLLARAAGATA